jgi:hypothetical protein
VKKFVILIPVYNDWTSVFILLKNIDLHVGKWDAEVSVLIVNDASTETRPKNEIIYKKIKSVKLINMRNNKGHARCNAAGLKFLCDKEYFDYVILMDGDGEDRPEELTLLFNKSRENPLKIVTANRVKRSESIFFKFLYQCHKILTYVSTGKLIKFGNYSCLPKQTVSKLIKDASTWSSFSGSVTKNFPDRVATPSTRGKRYFGPSQMNFINLLIHSFSIIGVFKKNLLVRSILFLIFYIFFIYQNLSIISLMPVAIIMIFLFFVYKISLRENINELNSSLENISNIETLK